jgi:hypothetical protein
MMYALLFPVFSFVCGVYIKCSYKKTFGVCRRIIGHVMIWGPVKLCSKFLRGSY